MRYILVTTQIYILHFRDTKDFRLLNRKTLIVTIYHGFLSVSTENTKVFFLCEERGFYV